MPFWVDCDLSDWRRERDPVAALVSAPARCLVYEGRERVFAVNFSPKDARLLLEAFQTCDASYFGMEIGGTQRAPFYAGAFQRESGRMSLFYYYRFEAAGDPARTLEREAYSIYCLAQRIFSSRSGIDECFVPLALIPPEDRVVSSDKASKQVPSFPQIRQQPCGDGVLLSPRQQPL